MENMRKEEDWRLSRTWMVVCGRKREGVWEAEISIDRRRSSLM